MQAHQASRTAELVTLCRALDLLRPEGERLLDDTFAPWFLGPLTAPAFRTAQKTGSAGRWLAERVPRMDGGLATAMPSYIQVRHRFIDDALQAALDRGVAQVVIAGAGYDCRAYRFADRLAGRPVYELDFPSTSRRKHEILDARHEALPEANVERVEVDFVTERIDDALARTSFRPEDPTFFVWEGVSMYLSREAVKQTLGSLRAVAAPGSEVAFDLWYLLDTPSLGGTAHRVSPNIFHFVGEPIVFSMHPEDLPDFLAREGLAALESASTEELAGRYLGESRTLVPGVYVARAGFDGRP